MVLMLVEIAVSGIKHSAEAVWKNPITLPKKHRKIDTKLFAETIFALIGKEEIAVVSPLESS